MGAADAANEERARTSHPTGAACPGTAWDVTWDAPASLRGDLLTAEHLEEHGAALAESHRAPTFAVAPGPLRERYLAERVRIRDVYAILAREAPRKRELSPAEEWLLDNSHIVEDQLREIEEDLPAGYLLELPRMAGGAMRGYPLVYGLCIDYLRHTDARIELDSLARFVIGYQTRRSLTIGELWAVPIMLRLGLVLTVGTLAASEVSSHDRELADEAAEKLLSRPESVRAVFAKLEKTPASKAPAFLVHLLRRLREHDAPSGIAFDWVKHQCELLGFSPEELTRRQHLRQAADQVSVGNSITSMRAIAALDWNRFFERTSVVEDVLRRDPALAYEETDEASRDRYRHAVEDIARRSEPDEREVAEAAIARAEASRAVEPDELDKMHVGFYLVGDGRFLLERDVGYRRPLRQMVQETARRHAALGYVGAIVVLALVLPLLVVLGVHHARAEVSWPLLAALALLLALPASELAVTLVNALVIPLLPPARLAKLALLKGVPPEHRTLVVVPALLDSDAGVRALVAHLEVRALANADENLHFALLTDFVDHVGEEHPGDARLLALVKSGIEELNRRSAGARPDRFLLLHRRRVHNPRQGSWMGWERKRGKLEELNRLLRGANDTTFNVVTGTPELLASIRFVITLDADTELPREVARKLVATIAHPLNRARFDAKRCCVVRGYGVIQPRVGTDPVSARRSWLSRIIAGEPGIDPYTTAVSDVYQDLFGEGSYIGKAIYDVDAFAAALAGRVPENTLLSHDLFEGLLARTALATDIELLDDQPASYEVMAARQHRWIRGDWQLLPWLWRRVPTCNGAAPNDLSPLGRWKLFDNLRRSLVAPGLIALLGFGWFVSPALAAVATLSALVVVIAPLLSQFVTSLLRPSAAGAKSPFARLRWDVSTHVVQRGLGMILIFDHAVVAADAIARTLYRLLVSRRNLLEWQTMGQMQRRVARARGRSGRRLWLESAAAAAALAALGVASPSSLAFALPVLLAWASAPLVTSFLSRPLPPRDRGGALSPADVRELRLVARKTWRFFETFVTAEDGFLPPDNYQEEPRGVVAHRTSPTNMGLYLLSVAAARDFGFVTLSELSRRVSTSLGSIERLERREGHVLNWYDTSTQKPLEPRYISTVDSGNLAAYLWTLRQACADASSGRLVTPATLDAATDALALALVEGRSTDPVASARMQRELAAARPSLEGGLSDALKALRELARSAYALPADKEATGARARDLPPTMAWGETAARTLREAERELASLAPWIDLVSEAPQALAARALFHELVTSLDRASSLTELAEATKAAEASVDAWTLSLAGESAAQVAAFLSRFRDALLHSHEACAELTAELAAIGKRAVDLADGMNFAFLYNDERGLFSIGYNVSSARLDGSHYDLLASEARLASLIAIAKGDAPLSHWFRLSRPRAAPASGPALLSWSGSMFEYLMPLLVTRSHERTLLDETYDSIVVGQRDYGRERDVPWGISESAYNIMDLSMTYQYHAFGVPGFGLKAGLEDDLVVAPYATALAALVRPDLAVENFRALRAEGLDGPFGFYESIDYTPTHAPPGRRGVVVKAFMAHHQGMVLVALGGVICGSPMQRRFHADRRVQASELLLEERVPSATAFVELREAHPAAAAVDLEGDVVEHVGLGASGPLRAHLLGHGELTTVVTAVGTGLTRWKGLDVHRVREDAVLGTSGILVYLRDVGEGRSWSAGYQPMGTEPDRYDAAFSPDRVLIQRRDGDVETLLEIGVSPEHPAEVRRVTLTNHGSEARDLELTTYTEVVLAPHDADAAHPAFSGLFVETSAIPDKSALLAKRTPRAPGETETWVMQVLASEEGEWGPFEWDTSRATFLGRGRTVESPRNLEDGAKLSSTAGTVLDPALILRRRVRLEPGRRARIALTTGLAPTRDEVVELADIYGAGTSIARTFELGWADARVELRHLGMTGAEADRYQRLLSAILFPTPSLRAELEPAMMRGATKTALWSLGVSGDLPILVVRLDDVEIDDLCREVLLAHEFWRLNGMSVDVVLLDEEPAGYNQPVHERILGLIAAGSAQGRLDQRGGVFVRRAHQLTQDHRALLLGAARAVLVSSRGSLGRQLRAAAAVSRDLPPRRTFADSPPEEREVARPRPVLAFDNGVGGFAEGGREYVITASAHAPTPAPWVNVIANPQLGCIVSEAGASVTWSMNSQSHRLTPWSNDPTSDPSGEVVYVRDDEDGAVWTPTLLPAGGAATCEIRHGQGSTSFHQRRGTLEQALTVFVDAAHPLKVCRLSIRNGGTRTRRLSVCGVVEWVLGTTLERGRLTVVTEADAATGALYAFNPFSTFPERHAFFLATRAPSERTCDREEFFGRSGSRARPEALGRTKLSGRAGVGLDPCAALLVPLVVAPGETVEVSFVLGDGENRDDAQRLVAMCLREGYVADALRAATAAWDETLGAVTVRTPDPGLDLLVNRWLLYQALGSRVWARAAFYQSGGAYGFRDQLQDVLALLHARPELAREHIVRAAARQFVEGDVQHWWHADTGEGVRTRCSDDMLWLPYVTAEYVRATGDAAILDESIPFLHERLLKAEDHDLFSSPAVTRETASLYEHCLRALDRGTTAGEHGIPLMGTGDWNDGMSLVGAAGKGESVWLGWLLVKTLRDFAPLAATRGDTERVARSAQVAVRAVRSIEESGWDGGWYRRAYFDDGTALGSRENTQCRIDAIAQSWAVIAGAGDPQRAERAVKASIDMLVREPDRMMLLFTPPFTSGHGGPDPGYIQAYPQGIRENGGQYTHGVLWTALAQTLLGDGDGAAALLELLSPLRHATTVEEAHRYAVEPYVVAADVYAASGLIGRGGWTWYTGSASWMYRIIVEHLLGISLSGGRLIVAPCVPPSWKRYEVDYRRGRTVLHITVDNPSGVSRGPCRVELDGNVLADGAIPIPDDGVAHEVRVTLLAPSPAAHGEPPSGGRDRPRVMEGTGGLPCPRQS